MPLPGESRAITGALPIARSTLTRDSQLVVRTPNTPAPGHPAPDFTHELDHAARVTKEEEMDILSPPFSSCREGIRCRQSLQKQMVL